MELSVKMSKNIVLIRIMSVGIKHNQLLNNYKYLGTCTSSIK